MSAVGNVALSFAPSAMAFNGTTGKLYVIGGYGLVEIDGAANAVTTVPLPDAATNGGLYGVAVDSLTNRIYTIDYIRDLTIINGADFGATILSGLGGPGFFYPFVIANEATNQVYIPYIAPGGGAHRGPKLRSKVLPISRGPGGSH